MLILARADRATPPRRAQAASIPQRIRSRSIAGHPGRSGTESVRWKIDIFRVVAALAGLFFVVAVVLMASAPWVLLQPDQEVRTELNRWFLTVAGSVDAITAACCSPSHNSRAGRSWSSSW